MSSSRFRGPPCELLRRPGEGFCLDAASSAWFWLRICVGGAPVRAVVGRQVASRVVRVPFRRRGALTFVVSILVLAWPVRRRRPGKPGEADSFSVREGVERKQPILLVSSHLVTSFFRRGNLLLLFAGLRGKFRVPRW